MLTATDYYKYLRFSIGLLASGLWHVQGNAAPAIEHWTHPTGAQVYLMSNPSLPMVDVQLDFDAGSRRDPIDKAGLAQSTAQMLDKGVIAFTIDGQTQPALDENQQSDAWADVASQINQSVSKDRFTVQLRTLSDAAIAQTSLRLLAQQLAAPQFDNAVWKRLQAQNIEGLKESLTQPETVVERAFEKAVFGDHPYGAQITQQTLAAITADDLRHFWQQHLRPCRAVISLVGDLDRKEAQRWVDMLINPLQTASTDVCPALTPIAKVTAVQMPRQEWIPFSAEQAHVRIGQVGYARNDPAFFPLLVGSTILGEGGFTSRLTHEVREKRGLSYSVYSYFEPIDQAGAFTAGLQTKPAQAQQAVQVTQQVIADFVRLGPTEQELKAAKDNLINSFALRIDNNRKLLANVANIGWNKLPLNYLDTWTQQVAKVSTADVRQAMQRVLQPDRMVTIVVGAASAPAKP